MIRLATVVLIIGLVSWIALSYGNVSTSEVEQGFYFLTSEGRHQSDEYYARVRRSVIAESGMAQTPAAEQGRTRTQQAHAKVFVSKTCKDCERFVSSLRYSGIRVETLDIETHAESWNAVQRNAHAARLPLTIINGDYVVGNDPRRVVALLRGSNASNDDHRF